MSYVLIKISEHTQQVPNNNKQEADKLKGHGTLHINCFGGKHCFPVLFFITSNILMIKMSCNNSTLKHVHFLLTGKLDKKEEGNAKFL